MVDLEKFPLKTMSKQVLFAVASFNFWGPSQEATTEKISDVITRLVG